MLRGVRDRVRATPALARLLSLASLLLIAASAHSGARSGGVAWLSLLVAGVVLALVTGATAHRWPLPAIWLVVTLLAAAGGTLVSVAWLVGALIGGAVALAAALFLYTAALRRARRSGTRP
ncbi:hypothetical protein M3666_11085 [Curtobacterium sp. ODYSSEY 48 V2]|uniref:hypothetical protein n=1 Tax=Curtobacterium sp. ODYSSEY 48 V2 TaxID=2939561 RepID=UPI00203DBAF9|nr:hypothetical protein [Curtobacterium sp. ODYSSEY 48 V2]MCM3505655.1 hypothetical protein [Curtobacterium sp. ODYSSEY 48 V2]